MKVLIHKGRFLLIGVFGLLLAVESVVGNLATLFAGSAVEVRGGGECYTSLSANDETCPDYGGSTCADNACEKKTRKGGGDYYHCNQYHIKIKEFDGYMSKVNEDQQTGSTQHLTMTFKCSKKQNCQFGEHCTEVTSGKAVTWKCLNDGAAEFSDEKTNHYAGGSSCRKGS